MDLGLLKTIHSYLENETQPFKFILLATSYLYKDSLENIKNINNTIARRLSKKVIKSNNKVRALISVL